MRCQQQAESTNKIIKANLRKVINNNPLNWDELLSEVLWAYRTSKRLSINTTPFSLVYGHDAVLPVEITIESLRVAKQNQPSQVDYESAMMVEMDDLDEAQVAALNSIILQKQKVTKSYNRRIRPKTFVIGDLVWKVILPSGTKEPYLGKWSSNWEGPYLISQLFDGNAYKLMHHTGEEHIRSISRKYLKPYKPSFNEMAYQHKKF